MESVIENFSSKKHLEEVARKESNTGRHAKIAEKKVGGFPDLRNFLRLSEHGEFIETQNNCFFKGKSERIEDVAKKMEREKQTEDAKQVQEVGI